MWVSLLNSNFVGSLRVVGKWKGLDFVKLIAPIDWGQRGGRGWMERTDASLLEINLKYESKLSKKEGR